MCTRAVIWDKDIYVDNVALYIHHEYRLSFIHLLADVP